MEYEIGERMIRIEITKHGTETYEETQQICTKEVPTPQRVSKSYGNGEEVVYEREYAPTKVTKQRDTKRTVLMQELADGEFDAPAVIAAINGLKEA
jgi:hypothetical protein